MERLFPVTDVTTGDLVTVECQIETQNIVCREVSPRELVDAKKKKFLICLAIEVPVIIRVFNRVTGVIITPPFTQTIVVLKQVVLCAPAGTEVQCDVTGNCCCVFDPVNLQVNCVFNLCIVIKTKATIHVLVPTLGLCVPPPCETVVTGCPPILPKDCPKDCD